jgi:hypothetical protein
VFLITDAPEIGIGAVPAQTDDNGVEQGQTTFLING